MNMSKRVYISADYDPLHGDQNVVNELVGWGADSLHKVDFIDMADVKDGVSGEDDCRICDLKAEFNRRINASSAAIFIVGNKTQFREAGSLCERYHKAQYLCSCTPYKKNVSGSRVCKIYNVNYHPCDWQYNDLCTINDYSYLRHEFEQSVKKGKDIIILYNSTRYETSWLPDYMYDYQDIARPFWKINAYGKHVGDYSYIKEALGF